MRPGVGRRPTTLLKAAGVRKLPPRSEPSASQTWPVASATAAPPEEPAAESRVSQGLRVMPNTGLKVLAPTPNSGVFDFATTRAPFASSRSTRMLDCVGTWSA